MVKKICILIYWKRDCGIESLTNWSASFASNENVNCRRYVQKLYYLSRFEATISDCVKFVSPTQSNWGCALKKPDTNKAGVHEVHYLRFFRRHIIEIRVCRASAWRRELSQHFASSLTSILIVCPSSQFASALLLPSIALIGQILEFVRRAHALGSVPTKTRP